MDILWICLYCLLLYMLFDQLLSFVYIGLVVSYITLTKESQHTIFFKNNILFFYKADGHGQAYTYTVHNKLNLASVSFRIGQILNKLYLFCSFMGQLKAWRNYQGPSSLMGHQHHFSFSSPMILMKAIFTL